MKQNNHRTLARDVNATVIPAGDAITLSAGTQVDITHRLGGNFTVVCDHGMFRILGKDADALGESLEEQMPASSAGTASAAHSGPPNDEAVWDALKTVYDPEIPVNIVDLGLVYSMQVEEMEEDKYAVLVHMTLTAPGCGMGPAIAEDAKTRIEGLPGVHQAQVDIVWDPPWTQDMITEEGKMELGLI